MKKHTSLNIAELNGDLGFKTKENLGFTITTPYKKPKKGSLSKEQELFNYNFRKKRVAIEHVNCFIKFYSSIGKIFKCNLSRFIRYFRSVVTFYNLYIFFKLALK